MSSHAPEEVLARIDRMESCGLPEDGERIKLRQFRRHTVRGDALLTPVFRGRQTVEPIEVQLRDVARGGLAFLLREQLEAQSSYQITFVDNNLAVGTQEIVIRHCRAVSPTLFLAGAQFVVDSSVMLHLGISADDIAQDLTQAYRDQGGDFDAVDQVA